jgi:tetratricopeptide (TPR) repeat protein
MKSILKSLVCGLVVACLSPVAVADEAKEGQIIDAFLKSVREDKAFSQQQIDAAVAVVEELRKDEFGRYEAITVGLSELFPEYKAALVQLAQEEPAAALVALQRLSASDQPFLAADASYYLSRAHILEDRFDEALPLLEQVSAKMADKTVLMGEVVYLLGVCESRLLKREAAVATFERFLKEFPAAPERMKIGALRQLEQLKQFKPETIADVFERMDFARRRLSREDTGTPTQEQQEKVVDILAKLIKEAEEKECNCAGGGQGEGQQQAGGQGGGGEGEGQGGDGSGSNDKSLGPVVKKIYRGPQSPWSQLRDKSRDPAYSALKEKFPARYEKLIEQYYRSFDEE